MNEPHPLADGAEVYSNATCLGIVPSVGSVSTETLPIWDSYSIWTICAWQLFEKKVERRNRKYPRHIKLGIALSRRQILTKGSLRYRLPVSRDSALAIAGEITGTGGSPQPEGFSVLGTM